MEYYLEYTSPQFAVKAQFKSFSALKYVCICAALLNVYEFISNRVDNDCYTLKCKNKGYNWYLYATVFPGTDVWQI